MKPVQVHRILKERVILESQDTKPSGLVPLIHHAPRDLHLRAQDPLLKHDHNSCLIPHKNQNSNPLLPRIVSNVETDLGKRIKELEKENFKLNHHVQQAEQTMRNYRSLLLKHNINPAEPISAPVPAPVPQSSTPPKVPEKNEKNDSIVAALQDTISGLQADLASLQAHSAQLDMENKSLTQSLADYKSKQGGAQELVRQAESLQQGLRVRERKIHEMENEMAGYKTEIQRHVLRNKKLHCLLEEVFEQVRCLKQEQLELRGTIHQGVQTVHLHLQSQLSHILHRTKQPKSVSPKKASPVKAQVAERGRLFEEELEALRAQLESSRAQVDMLTTHMQTLSNATGNTQAELAQAQSQVSALTERLQNVQVGIQDMQTLHQGEVKAVRHVAHIKELRRLAKEREESIEKDRLGMEVKYLKDIQSLLVFALNTAEHSLQPTLPHVVVKLQESRDKRAKQVEMIYKSKLKDLEQRSKDTNAVSFGQLEVLLEKAVKNEKNVEDMRKESEERLGRVISGGEPM